MTSAVRIRSFGGPEVLEVVEVPDPVAPEDGVVIDVRAAGVNPIDWKIREGRTASGPLTEPIGLGSDACGVVTSVGADPGRFAVGDAVIARGLTGAYASRVAAPSTRLTSKPPSLSFEEGAALGMPAGTAYQSLKSLGVRAGETLLVHAGSGAVGLAAVQFAHQWGLTVIATASPAHHARLAELGAIPVAYGDGLLERLRAAAPGGIDVALDIAGTDEALHTSLDLVADRSRIATLVAFQAAADLGIRLFSEHFGGGLGSEGRALRVEGVAVAADLAERGLFEIDIAAIYPLERVADAHRQSQTGHVNGKIVLVPTP
ncbi:NADP-dependent oxidoreductase [Parafrigoribacterium mesophilum]|uniref:NADP-dependent oxidoreductase n=1 Tax=Parafrigoribacterium mesophilum TaxID=433646 RepID=UPI0031FD5239